MTRAALEQLPEYIPGLQDSSNLTAVRATIGSLAREGYCVADFVQLDAAAYGVPQHRVRPFWFGHRGGPCIRWPEPTHGAVVAPMLPGVPALRPWVTCREALAHLPVGELGRPVRLRHEGASWRSHPPSVPDAPARTVLAGSGSGSRRALELVPGHPVRGKRDPSTRGPQSGRIGDPERPCATIDARPARVGQGDAHVFAWPWDRPSTVVCASTDKLAPPGRSGSHGEPQAGHPNAIILSERAAMILQGFPDGWHIAGTTKAARWAQIGQAVPPQVAAAIGRCVRAWFARGAEAVVIKLKPEVANVR